MCLFSCVSGSDLMLCGNYIYNQYHDCHDVAYCLCADELNDVLVLPTENRTLTPVLACKDRMIRILQVPASFCSSVLLTIFTTRRNARIASVVLAIAIPSICLSVCLSHADIVSKRLHVARCSLHHQIAKCV